MKRNKYHDQAWEAISGSLVVFGRSLAATRKKRSLSVADVSHLTRIRPCLVQSIEAGDLAAFGGIAYARSFVRTYSVFLGIDCMEFLELLPALGPLDGKPDDRYLTEVRDTWQRDRESNAGSGWASPGKPTIRQMPSFVPAAAAMFLMALGGTTMWGMHLVENDFKGDRPGAQVRMEAARGMLSETFASRSASSISHAPGRNR